jgi:dihydroorotase
MKTLVCDAINENGQPVHILIEAENILAVSSQIADFQGIQDVTKINADGLCAIPGLMDAQVHFRDPGQSHKETMQTGAQSAVAGGFTRVLCMANTQPPLDSPELISTNLKKAAEIGKLDIYTCATLSKGLLGKELTDFVALKQAGALAITDDGKGVQSDELMWAAFELAAKVKIPILDHAEDDCCNQHGVIHPSTIAQKWQLPVSVPEGESNHVNRGVDYSLKTGTAYHVLHMSTQVGIQALQRGKKLGANVSGEVSPHHLLLSVDDIPDLETGPDPNYKMNPTLKSASDRAACVAALLDGTFDAIATDHAPHTENEKALGFLKAPFGIVGLETCFPLIYTHFVKTKLMSLQRAVYLMNDGPAKIYGLTPNQVSAGKVANFTLVDLNNARRVNAATFYSMGRNTPFQNQNLYGWPRMTFYRGKIVFQQL